METFVRSTQSIPTQIKTKVHAQTPNTNPRRVSPFSVSLVKKYIRLRHAGIINHSDLSIPTKEKYKKEED